MGEYMKASPRASVQPVEHPIDDNAGGRYVQPNGERDPAEPDVPRVSELVEMFLRAWGEGTWQDVSRPGDPPEAQVLRLSSSKAARELGWRSRWRIGEAVARTARWYRRFAAEPRAARAACLDDICDYSTALLIESEG